MTEAEMGDLAGIPAKAMETREVVAALSALAQDTRLAIFKLLVQAGSEGMAAGQVGYQLGINPSSISFHMKELSHAGLVKSRQEGRFVIYSVDYPAMEGVMTYLSENCCTSKPANDCTVAVA
jgi:ArsR family transcriptional regulator, arsenate/arsenite/antimonite-responsive transcriptional repressor